MTSYYFYHSTLGVTLAAVYAKTEEKAWELLPSQHSWANANSTNCKLVRTAAGTEWDRICG